MSPIFCFVFCFGAWGFFCCCFGSLGGFVFSLPLLWVFFLFLLGFPANRLADRPLLEFIYLRTHESGPKEIGMGTSGEGGYVSCLFDTGFMRSGMINVHFISSSWLCYGFGFCFCFYLFIFVFFLNKKTHWGLGFCLVFTFFCNYLKCVCVFC